MWGGESCLGDGDGGWENGCVLTHTRIHVCVLCVVWYVYVCVCACECMNMVEKCLGDGDGG